ncbi:MAG: hypothetical protein IJZ31_02545, partial [Bacteroidaceae bacterium]|nr:hypothetical protein [Bacteroidaceae bacterium]
YDIRSGAEQIQQQSSTSYYIEGVVRKLATSVWAFSFLQCVIEVCNGGHPSQASSIAGKNL